MIGLHSGTSADGPASVVARISGAAADTRAEVLAFETYTYESPLRERIFGLFACETATVDRVMQADIAIGEFFAEAARRVAATAGLTFDDVDLIGHHYAARVRDRARELGLDDADVVTTVTAFSGEAIAFAFREFVFPRAQVDDIYVAGGAHNETLLRMLRERLGSIRVGTTAEPGVPVASNPRVWAYRSSVRNFAISMSDTPFWGQVWKA